MQGVWLVQIYLCELGSSEILSIATPDTVFPAKTLMNHEYSLLIKQLNYFKLRPDCKRTEIRMKEICMFRILFLIGVLGVVYGCTMAHPINVDMVTAANRVIDSLDDNQKDKAIFSWDSDKSQEWAYVPDRWVPGGYRERFGLPLSQMNDAQVEATQALLKTVLSQEGHIQVNQVRDLEVVVAELRDYDFTDPDLYYLSFFGAPSNRGNWSWRFEGHHLSINVTILDGRLFSITPSMFGADPETVPEGPMKDLQVLEIESKVAFELLNSLSDEQKDKAIFCECSPVDVLTSEKRSVDKRDFLPAKGIRFDQLGSDQQSLLRELVGAYVNKYRPDLIHLINNRSDLSSGRGWYFAWAGSLLPDKGHYYRVQTPKFLFEYVNYDNQADHAHAVWRDFNGDFGADLLRTHYQTSHVRNVERNMGSNIPSDKSEKGSKDN